MKTIIEYLFFLSFIIAVLLSGLSFVISRKMKSKEFIHLTEFWASLAGLAVISYIFRSGGDHMVAWSLVGWIWPMKTILQVAQDMSGIDLYHRSKVLILAFGGFLTLVLARYGFSFGIATAPFCLSLGAIGGILLGEVYTKADRKKISFLGHASFFFLGLLFATQLFFPVWRMASYNTYLFAARFVVLSGLAATTLAFYMETLKDRQEKLVENALKERSEHFLGQSKYSELGMMSAGIAHEINNPLAIIQAKTTQLLRLIRDPARIPEVTAGLEQILYTSERINRTVQGVRDFVHQNERSPNEEFSVKTLVDDVLVFCGQRMKNHGVNLRLYGLDNYSLRGHKIQLEQVLLNLLNNAFDAIEFLPDKWIELSVHQTENTIQIYVKDSGSGIPPETACHMMEAFYTTKKVGKGTGLGLALARGIVEKHGGSLVYIGNTRHTTFMIELPKPGLFRPLSNDYDQGRTALH